MIKKLFFIFIIFSNIFFVYSSSNCYFETNNCQRTSDSFNTFNLNFENLTLLDSFKAKIYLKENSANKIRVEINQIARTVNNLNPFIEPGVYILEIEAISKSGSKKISNYEFIYDNLEPMPPIIPLNLIGNSLVGKTQFGNMTVLVEDGQGNNLFTGNSDENGSIQINLNLQNQINYVKFYSKNSNEIKSAPVERIIFQNKIIGNIWTQITSINIEDLNLINDRTVAGITSKRNFYVSGTSDGSNGGIVYVNGIKTLTDSSGNFGQFILLNEGVNKIQVENLDGSITTSTQISYINPRFQFREFKAKKVIGEDNLNINVKTNYELPFNVYLNGQYYRSVISSNQGLNFSVKGFKPGKNYLYLEGLNNQRISKIIYYDTKNPKINLIISNQISKKENFIFEIKDDISINLSSINVNFNNGEKIYSGEKIERIGDFYKIDLSDLINGDYSFTISAQDLSGKLTTFSDTLNLANSNTFIKDIYVENGDFIGNRLFLDSSKTKITLTPSRYIAFKSIFLDGKRYIDYEIKPNGEVSIKNLVDLKSNGILKLNFVNNNLEEFSQIYYYFSDTEKPIVNLDYIENAQSFENKTIRISGEIIDSHFDWSTLNFNLQDDFIRYGKYFEAYVKTENNNFNIDGLDFAKNQISNGDFGGILYNDNSNEQIQVQQDVNSISFNSVLINSDIKTKKYLSSYDGFDLSRVYLVANDFDLPVAQRNGLRSINLKGVESSQMKFSNYDKFSIDSIEPEIYFVNNNGKKEIIFDGTLSEIDRKSINISLDGNPLNEKNFCQNSLSIFSDCIEISNFNDKIIVNVSDVAGNSISKTFTNNDIVYFSTLSKFSSKKPQIYFSGNDKITNVQNYFIQGQIRSFNKIKSVMQAGNNCDYDDFNFVCEVDLELGVNNFEVKVIDINSQEIISNWPIIYIDNSNFNTQIFNITGGNIYKSGNDYFINSLEFLMDANVSKESLIKLIINGEEVLIGNKNKGNFNVALDFSEQTNDKEVEKINVLIEAEDELGNTARSDSILLIFNRVIKTFVSVFID